jgi:hypothetical protein
MRLFASAIRRKRENRMVLCQRRSIMIPDQKLEFDAERREVAINVDDVTLDGTLVVPRDATGVV